MKKAALVVLFGYLLIILYYLKVTKPIKDSFPAGLKVNASIRKNNKTFERYNDKHS